MDDFSAYADGEHRGLDRIGGWHREGLGETRLLVPLDRHGFSAFAVGMLRDIEFFSKKKGGAIFGAIGCGRALDSLSVAALGAKTRERT